MTRTNRGEVAFLRLVPEGRGSSYSASRGALESVLRIAYARDWPARAWGRVPGANDVRVVERTFPLLPRGARPLRLGFASDLHVGPTTPPALLDRAFDLLRHLAPDVLLLGGDYVFLDATPAKAARVASLVARVPTPKKVAVLGNHDLWTRHDHLERALAGVGAQVLENKSILLRDAGVAIVGLDEPWTGRVDAHAALRDVPTDVSLVVLCHSPDAVPMLIEARRALGHSRPALYVCGHTHGGQVATPWGPIVVPGRLGKRYPHGEFALAGDGLALYVGRGLGGVEIPMRTFAPPEVAALTLVAME